MHGENMKLSDSLCLIFVYLTHMEFLNNQGIYKGGVHV